MTLPVRRLVLVLAAASALGALIVVGVFFWQSRPEAPAPDLEPTSGPVPKIATSPVRFRAAAAADGLDFHMAFLPTEQGLKFKVNLYDHGCGVAVGDFDNDGHEDVYFVNQLGPNKLYRNRDDGSFEDVTARAGVALGDRVCVAATFADYDNDGRLDLFVTSTRGGNVLFRNRGDGTFKDVTEAAGVALVAHSQTAAFFDYDNDGRLDLLVTNTARWTLGANDRTARFYPGPADFWIMALSPIEQNVLYHNNGNGTFSDATGSSGLAGKGWGGDVAVFDYDGDGKIDVLITNMFGASQLYRNLGDGTFIDDTPAALGRTSWGAIGAKAFDYDNDGRLDLFIADMHSDMWLPPSRDPRTTQHDLRKKYDKIHGPFHGSRPEINDAEKRLVDSFKVRYADVIFGNTFFHNAAGGTFTEVSAAAGVETWWPWGIVTGDFDNDGYEDVYLPSGMGYPYRYWPSPLLINNGDGTFTNRAAASGLDPRPGDEYLPEKIAGRYKAARSARCAVVADFDGDGRLDLVVNNFNGPADYFRNESPKKNFIAFRLTGTTSNRDAVGAVVRLYAGPMTMTRQVHAAGGYLSHSSRTLHFGLGERTKIDRVEITWPNGRRQTVTAPELNRRHQLTEPEN